MQLKEISKLNKTLRQDYAKVYVAYKELKGEQAQQKEVKKAFKDNDVKLQGMLAKNAKHFIKKGVTVKVMICKCKTISNNQVLETKH